MDSRNTPRTPRTGGDLERSKYITKSPRSARSTPRTNNSPHSMSLGDATPLYDENI